jgi:hypothetical protein
MRTLLRTALVFFTLSTSSAFAGINVVNDVLLSKTETRSQAVDICRTETVQRYGDKAIKRIAGKSSWSNDLQSALVKMKIKPVAQRVKQLYCVVKADKSVDYIVR